MSFIIQWVYCINSETFINTDYLSGDTKVSAGDLMVHRFIFYKIKILTVFLVLMFSGLMLINEWGVENASGNVLVFGTTWNSVATTGGGGVYISVNITTDGVVGPPNNAEVFFNFTINSPSGMLRDGNNISVTTRNGTNWTVVIKGPIPVIAYQIIYNFTAMNMTDTPPGVIRLSDQTINVIDNIKPTIVALDDQEVRPGVEVKFNATGCTDNVDTPDNLFYYWEFIYGMKRNLTGKLQTFTFDEPRIYLVKLSVKDLSVNWESETMTLTVLADELSINTTSEPAREILSFLLK